MGNSCSKSDKKTKTPKTSNVKKLEPKNNESQAEIKPPKSSSALQNNGLEIAPSPPENKAPIATPPDLQTPSSITFYCHPASAAARAVILLLEQFQLTYTVIFSSQLPGNTKNKRSDVDLASLTDSNFKISNVYPRILLLYISNQYQKQLVSPKQKSVIMQVIYSISLGDFGKIGEKITQPFIENWPETPKFQLTNVKCMRKQLAVLEQRLAIENSSKAANSSKNVDRVFLANGFLSVADLVCATQLDFFNFGDQDVLGLGKFPAVKTWFEHVKSLPGWSRMSKIREIAEFDEKRKSWVVQKQPKLTLYYHPVSPPARMILFFLLELNLEFETKLVDLAKHEQKEDWYLKINPVGKVPCLTVESENRNEKGEKIPNDSLTLIESRAIMKYLVNMFDVDEIRNEKSRSWKPRNISEKTALDTALYQDISGFYIDTVHNIAGPVIQTKTPPSKDYVEKFRSSMQILNDTLLRNSGLENSGFVAYDRMSAADISVAIGLDFAESVAGVVKLEKYPAVGKWYKTIKSLDSWVETNAEFETWRRKVFDVDYVEVSEKAEDSKKSKISEKQAPIEPENITLPLKQAKGISSSTPAGTTCKNRVLLPPDLTSESRRTFRFKTLEHRARIA